MSKKDTLRGFDPSQFQPIEESNNGFDINEFKVISTPAVEKDPFTLVQEKEAQKHKTDEIIANIPDMDDSRKQSLKELVTSGKIKGDQISNVILTYQGKHPKQSGGDSSKFYTDEKGIPHPLANNERPPKEYQINSIWGDQNDAEDDSPLTTLGKNVYNILPSLAENAIDLVHMPYGASTGKEADWYKSLKNSANYLKAKTSSASNAPVLNTEGIDEFNDVFDPKRWDFNADNVAGTVGQIVKSVGEFSLGGGFVSKAAGVTSKLGKGASLFTASYATQLGETIDRAKEAGLDTDDAYRVGSAINVPIALVDLGLGVEGRIFKDATAKAGRKELVDNLVSGFIKDSEGKITKEGLDELFKTTLLANTALVKNWGKHTVSDVVGEGSQEAIQQFIQNAGEQLYDKMSDEGKAKFGTDAFSPKAFSDYLQNFVVGAIGGVPAGVAYNKVKQITKDNEQSKTAFGLVQAKEGESQEDVNTRINSYKANIVNEVKQGKLTQEQADNAITKINAYKDYNDMLGSLPIDDTEKRQLFDLSFQKQGIETEISQVKDPKKLNPIEQAQYNVKEKFASDIQKQINEIVLKAQSKEETNLPKKTIEDVTKLENPKPKSEGEKKLKVPEHIQAILDRNKKETSKKEYPEEKRSYEQIPNIEFNNPTKISGGFRTIHKKAVEFLETQPGKQILGVIVHKPFEYGGKKNKTYGVQMPDGKILRFSSSMQRDEGFRGHMRTEHLVDENELEGFPIGLKVEEIPSFEEGKEPKKVIKAFNAKTGKFVGYMKETNTGKKTDEYNDKQKDYLEHLGTVIEPPIIPPTEGEEGGLPVTTKPKTPITPTKESIEQKKEAELKEARKPNLGLDFITKQDLLGKTVPTTITSGGEEMVTNVKVSKIQAEIKKKLKALEILKDCVNG
jgi:hypothetical protein